ncbi:MAG: hypothetical protein ACUVTW_05340 [Thermogutta sp.]
MNPAISVVPAQGYVVEDCLSMISISIVFGMMVWKESNKRFHGSAYVLP